MSRTISTSFRAATHAPQSADFPVYLATITHAAMTTQRVCSDNCDYLYGGQTYKGVSFNLSLLTDDDRPPRTRWRVMNANQLIGAAILPLTSPPAVSLVLVSSAEFAAPVSNLRSPIGTPSVEWTASGLLLRNVSGDVMFVEGDLAPYDLTAEPWGLSASQSRVPGAFRG